MGLWVGTGGEGAKYWPAVLTEIKNRGVDDVCIVVCDGLKGLPKSIEATWPLAVVQTCVLHLIRTFRLASRADWDKMARLHRRQRSRRRTLLGRVPHDLGQPPPGHPHLVVERLAGVRALLGLLAGDPASDLLDERDRVTQRQVPA